LIAVKGQEAGGFSTKRWPLAGREARFTLDRGAFGYLLGYVRDAQFFKDRTGAVCSDPASIGTPLDYVRCL
jgi:hypothetical protein